VKYMSASTTDSNFGILQQIFVDIANDIHRNPLEHMLILTYEFDDQQLVNLLSGRSLADNVELQRNQLKFIADMQPVVIYDARKTRDFNQIPHFLNLIPVNPGAFRCHHSKAYLFITSNTVRLVLGSFNLTRTGLFENREVYNDFLWSKKDTDDLNVLSDFSKLLRKGYSQWPQPEAAPAREAIADTLDTRLALWQNSEIRGKHSIVYSGYAKASEKNGLSHLATIWQSISKTAPRKLFVISPFFDRGETFLADELSLAIGAPDELHIVTDEDNIIKLGRCHFGMLADKQTRKLNLIPGSISTSERERISRANDGARIDGLQISRALHAKILIMCSGSHHLIYTGSANFTIKAWNGDNQELGVVSVENGPAATLIAYPRLSDTPTARDIDDDEDYVYQPAYPDFINNIRLEQGDDTDALIFRFDTTDQLRLLDYKISWGRVPLSINGTNSHPIQRRHAYMPLQGGRNLSFELRKDSTKVFLLPFFHHADLTQQQDLMLFPSVEEWMRHYLHPTGPIGHGEGEYLPGEEPTPPQPDDSSVVDREANVVVAMQRYLNLFSSVEATFDQRAHDIAANVDAAARAKGFEQSFAAPLRLYARLLEQDFNQSGNSTATHAYLFRLGELVMMCCKLAPVLHELIGLAHELAERLIVSPSDSTLTIYLNFVRKQLPHA